MKSVEIIAVGKMSQGPLQELAKDYIRRTQWPVTIIELDSKIKNPLQANQDEGKKILERLSSSAFIVIMDERGKSLKSTDFAAKFSELQLTGQNTIQFIIGGSDGLTPEIRARANMLLSFGQQTWPHMMARVMLLEQIYRAQQILAGHPYHRE
jgi:23S rRNA (pseudouridine1915-N3)-methyltransferase